MPETMCKVCLDLKQRLGTWPKFVDENGKWWHGLTCPECHKNDIKLRSRKAYKNNRGKVYKKARKCRKCLKNLPSDRYFKHRGCDYAHFASASNGQTSTVWVESDWGCGLVDGVRI